MNNSHCEMPINAHREEHTIAHDSEIVSAARAGSFGAFGELHAIYSRRLYRTTLAITKNPEDAEDALQETFLRACLSINTFEGRSTIYSWLTRIAINSSLGILRKRRVRAEICYDPLPKYSAEIAWPEIKDPTPNPEQLCDLRQRRVKLQNAIRKLDSGLREPVQMRLTNESSLREISQTLNISEGAVKARLYRARLQLSAVCGTV